MNATYETQLLCRAVDENGDMVFGAGDAGFVNGAEAMDQVIKTRLAAGAGEWWEGDDTAIPWFSEVLGSMIRENRVSEIDLLVVNRLLDTVGVTGVDNIQSSITGRQYHFSCTAHTVHGDVEVSI